MLIIPTLSTQTTERICSRREDFTKDILVIKYYSFCEIMCNIGGSAKLTSIASVPLIRVIDKSSQFSPRAKFVRYAIEPESNAIGVRGYYRLNNEGSAQFYKRYAKILLLV